MYPLLFCCLHLSYRQPQFKSVNPFRASQGDGNLSNSNVTNYVKLASRSVVQFFVCFILLLLLTITILRQYPMQPLQSPYYLPFQNLQSLRMLLTLLCSEITIRKSFNKLNEVLNLLPTFALQCFFGVILLFVVLQSFSAFNIFIQNRIPL